MKLYDIFAILTIASYGSFWFMELFTLTTGFGIFVHFLGLLFIILVTQIYFNNRREENGSL